MRKEGAVLQAIILCGGLGTRLRPIVSDLPKAMADIRGRPFLEYLLAQLRRSGFAQAVLCAGFKADEIRAHFGTGARFGLDLAYSIEDDPRGTAGALKLAEPLLEGDSWLLMNGDSFFDISIADLIQAHAQNPAEVTLALARVDDASRYGAVELGAKGLVTRFAQNTESHVPGLINGGIYVLERKALQLVPTDRAVSLESDLLPELVGHGMYGLPFGGFFVDIGVSEGYLRAQDSDVFLSLAVPD